VNGRRQKADVTEAVAKKVLGSRSYEVKILSESPLPVSQGFGVSSAAALSTALALDDSLGLGTAREELVAIAHETEVECGTGLGDVVPASLGGMDLRLRSGAPGHAEVRKIPVDADLLLAVLGPEMPTKAVLRDPVKVAAINRFGGTCVDAFAREPTLSRLFDLGNEFAEKTGLANKTLLEVVRASRMFGLATMAMLGNSVFASGNLDQLGTLYRKFGIVQRCEVENEGAHVL
jgi:pantoate kinase